MWTAYAQSSVSIATSCVGTGRNKIPRCSSTLLKLFYDSTTASWSARVPRGLNSNLYSKCKLIDHLDNWIRFAMFSRTKNLALDLVLLSKFMGRDDLYVLLSELFDKKSASCLRCLQVSLLCLKPPSQFLGFPNLRVLELYVFNTTRKDLAATLSV